MPRAVAAFPPPLASPPPRSSRTRRPELVEVLVGPWRHASSTASPMPQHGFRKLIDAANRGLWSKGRVVLRDVREHGQGLQQQRVGSARRGGRALLVQDPLSRGIKWHMLGKVPRTPHILAAAGAQEFGLCRQFDAVCTGPLSRLTLSKAYPGASLLHIYATSY